MELRQHQIKCIENINKNFENDNKFLIKMFCGSGKSFIIYHCLLQYGNNLSVVVVPSINLITQFNNDYLLNDDKEKYNKKYFNKDYELLTVCSKNEIDKKLQGEFVFTTDKDEILDFLEQDTDKIILITYQSLELLINIVIEYEFEIDLLCFDEAHHILGDNMKKLLFGTDEENEEDDYVENFVDFYVNKTLFFTATPKNSNGIKMYEPLTNITIDNEDYEIVDDEDSYIDEELHCGEMIFEYTHRDGVNDNVLNDFNVRVDLYSENSDEHIFDAIFRSIFETSNNRILTFHSRSETEATKKSNVISFVNSKNNELCLNSFNKIINNEFPTLKNKYNKITFEGITATTKNKQKLLKDFDETKEDEIYILSSCKTIGEGVDTKNANMVVFVDPKQSYQEIIQNIGRVCRKNENTKNLSTILIPTYVDVNKYKECKTMEEKNIVIRNEMSKKGNFETIMYVLSALKHEDPYIFEMCLKNPNTFTEKEMNDNLKKYNLEITKKEYTKEELFAKNELKYNNEKSEKSNFKKLSKKINQNIQIINNSVDEKDMFIDNEFDKTLYIVKKDEKYIKTKGNYNAKINKPNRNIKPKIFFNDELKILFEIEGNLDNDKKIFGGFIKSTIYTENENQWMEKLDCVKKYIDENHKKPSNKDKDNKIKKLGYFLKNQLHNYKNKIHLMKNKNIYDLFTNFLKKYKQYLVDSTERWKINLENVKKYIDKTKKKPSQYYKNIEIHKLGIFLVIQFKNYKNRKNIMKDENIYNLFTNFLEQYKDFFIDNTGQWKINLENVKNYIDEYKQRPNPKSKNIEIKKLGTFLDTQLQNYKNKKNIMNDENIYNLFTNFLEQYKEFFIDNVEQWKIKFENVKNYIDEFKQRPNQESKNIDIKKLGTFLQTQLHNYKNKKDIMKNENIYNLFTNFLEQYKEFIDNIEQWKINLENVKKFIDEHRKKPSKYDKNAEIKKLGTFLQNQLKNYKKKQHIMKDETICNIFAQFLTDYKEYFVEDKKPTKKSTTIKPKEENKDQKENTEIVKNNRKLSNYQEISKKMTIQKSITTKEMFEKNKTLWHTYHNERDHSFKGYDKQEEIPINKIIQYLEKKSNKKLKILDLGCGRNLIKEHFKNNKKFDITGYDYVSYNGSIECDISKLKDEDETIDICIYSQSLMGYNWKDYINEGFRVLRHNGMMIISESVERYEIIKNYIDELKYHIKSIDYEKTNRWFYLHIMNDKD